MISDARERIGAIQSLEEARVRIDKLNGLILEALSERSRYKVCSDYFDEIGDAHWASIYQPIVISICKGGNEEDMAGVIQAESKLEELLYERVFIGSAVAKYKNGSVENRKREEKIINYVRKNAPKQKYPLDPDIVETIFEFLMRKNKEIQEQNSPNGKGGSEGASWRSSLTDSKYI